MRRVTCLVVIIIVGILLDAGVSSAQEPAGGPGAVPPAPGKVILPPGITEEMLAPPPVPRFMLEKPSRPLTTDEMMQQAREAEQRAKPSRTGEAAGIELQRDSAAK